MRKRLFSNGRTVVVWCGEKLFWFIGTSALGIALPPVTAGSTGLRALGGADAPHGGRRSQSGSGALAKAC